MQVNLSYNTEDLTFLTTCNRDYHKFVDPFIHFCKLSNPGCKIEIWAENPDILKHIKDADVRIHQLPLTYHVATYRYIAEPTFATKYTYITDIDIMHTEVVQPFHIKHMQDTGLPFSNIRRNKKGQTERLSGLHFVDTKIWYNATATIRPTIEPKGQDEHMLFTIAKSVFDINKVSKGLSNRPIHGIHCSVGRNAREPYSSKGWELTSQKLAVLVDEVNKVGMFNKFFEDRVCRKVIDPILCNQIAKRFPYV